MIRLACMSWIMAVLLRTHACVYVYVCKHHGPIVLRKVAWEHGQLCITSKFLLCAKDIHVHTHNWPKCFQTTPSFKSMNFAWSEKNLSSFSSLLGKCALKHVIVEINSWWCHKGHNTSPKLVARPARSLICHPTTSLQALCDLSLKRVKDPTKEVKLWL